MATDRTPTDRPLVGILVPDEDLNFWPGQSTVTEASPYPGEVVADRATNMTIQASGTPVNAANIDVLCQSGGLPRPESASIVWKLASEGATAYRGWNEPTTLQRLHIPTRTVDTNQGYRWPQFVVTDEHVVVMAASNPDMGGGSEARRVAVRTRDADGTWNAWSTLHTEDDPDTGGNFLTHPALVILPNGDIELYHFTYNHTADSVQVKKWITKDDGTTWEVAAEQVLIAPISYSGVPDTNMKRLQVAHHSGQHVMVIGTEDVGGGNDEIRQYRSYDGGYNFEPVGSNLSDRAHPQLTVSGGYFVLAMIDSNATGAYSRRIADAAQPYSNASDVSITGATATSDFCEGLVADPSGRLWCLIGISGSVKLTYSDDHGATWSSATREILRSSGSRHKRGSAGWWRGQLVYASNHSATAGHGAHVMYWHQFGGYTDVCMPFRFYDASTTGPFKQATWDEVWTPIDDVDAVTGMTQSGAGNNPTYGTINVATFTGTSVQDRSYIDIVSTNSIGATATMCVTVTDGESHLRCTTGDGAADDWGCLIEVKADGTIDFTDSNSAASIGSASITAGVEVEILMSVRAGTAGNNDGQAAAWYRLTSGDEDNKQWTAIGNTSALTTYVGNGDTVRWRAVNDGGAYDVDLRRLAYRVESSSSLLAKSIATPPTNPDDLRGRELSVRPIYLTDSISIRAAGLAHGGDSWTIQPGHTYEVQNMLPKRQPSPNTEWRSTSGGEQVVAFKLNQDGNDSYLGSDTYGIYLGNVKCHRVKVELRQGGAWVSQGNFDLTVEVPGVTVVGHVLIPRTSGSSETDRPWINRDEFAGQPFEFYDGGSTYETRTIGCNYAGTWDAGAIDEHRAAAILSDSDGTETSRTFNCHLWAKNAVIILHLKGSNTAEGIRITFNPGGIFADAPTGDVRCGTLAMGPIQVLGWAPDNTRAVALDLGSDRLTTHPDGTRTRERLAAPHRRVELSWARNSRLTSFQGSQHEADGRDPDYVTGTTDSGAEPVASRYGSPLEFMGLLQERGRRPMVYLPKIPRGAIGTNTFVLTRNRGGGAIYGRYMPDSYRLETVRGAPERDETVRTSVITIEEER